MKKFKLYLFTLLSVMIVGIMNVNAEEYVARIGEDSYNFQDFLVAFTQTQENDEVVILQDIDLTSIFSSSPEGENSYYVPLADNVVVDLNGHSITTNNHSLTYVGNNITIKNGKFIVKGYGTENEGSYALFLGRGAEATNGYVLEDLILEGGLNVYNAKGVVLNNVKVTGTNYYAVWAEYNATVTINSGNFSSKNISVFAVRNHAESNITINGGNVVIGDIKLYNTSSDCKAPVVVGGTYDKDVKDYVAAGYVSEKVGETYSVFKEHTVTIGTVTAGKLSVDKNKAIVGETITLTLTPNEGYELSKLEVKTSDGKDVEVKDNAFVMPDAAVTVTAVYKEITTTAEIPVINETTEVEEVVVGVKEAGKVEEILLESLKENEELAKVAEDKSVKVVVEIESVKESSLDKDVVETMKEEAGKTTIAEFFDINILVKDVLDNSNLGNITELTEEIELMILLPEKLKNSDEETTRKYYVVRHHVVDGKEEVELIDAEVSKDGNYLVFKTNKFSTYALAYEDVAATPNTPQTGDSIGLYIILGFISVAVIGLSLNSLKKRKSIKG